MDWWIGGLRSSDIPRQLGCRIYPFIQQANKPPPH
jgi:hypothetical protein